MPTAQLDEFNDKLAVVVYFNSEEVANENLLDVNLVERWQRDRLVDETILRQIYRLNGGDDEPPANYDDLFRHMVEEQIIKVAIVISGQGPEAFGMPEMFSPMQHINANQTLQKLSVLISDGRYSGVTYGAAIGHVTPEAVRGGGILYLQDGDIVQLGFRSKQMNLLDVAALRAGRIEAANDNWTVARAELGAARLVKIIERRRQIAAGNRLLRCTDSAHGVVPNEVWEEAEWTTAQQREANSRFADLAVPVI